MGFKREEGRGRSTDVRYLLTRGRAAAKAGSKEEARHYLEWVLLTESDAEEKNEAWYWLAVISEGPAAKRRYLEEIFARNPTHARARRLLALMDGRLQEEDLINPEDLPVAPVGTRAANSHRFLCPRCAARMVFAPDGESLYCEHCGYGKAPQAGREAVSEQDFFVAMATARGHSRAEAMQAFTCDGCAASFLLAPETISITCPYCDATYSLAVMETRELVPPQGIIPFTFTEEEAQRRVNAWLTQKKVQGRSHVHGVYLPVWTFDIGGAVRWRGHENGYEQSTKSWRPVSGSYPIAYDDYLVPGCDTLPVRLAQAAIRHFDLAQVVNFEREYLAAWPAQTYEISVGDASLAARRGVLAAMRQEVLATLAGRVSEVQLSSAEMMVVSFKLLLLPLWLARYTLAGNTYTVVVNGQTGAVGGEKPRHSLREAVRDKASRWLQKWLR